MENVYVKFVTANCLRRACTGMLNAKKRFCLLHRNFQSKNLFCTIFMNFWYLPNASKKSSKQLSAIHIQIFCYLANDNWNEYKNNHFDSTFVLLRFSNNVLYYLNVHIIMVELGFFFFHQLHFREGIRKIKENAHNRVKEFKIYIFNDFANLRIL